MSWKDKSRENKEEEDQKFEPTKGFLKNLGKYAKSPLSALEEFDFFAQIQPIFEKKYNCKVLIMSENDSQEKKAAQALPGKPAIIIK